MQIDQIAQTDQTSTEQYGDLYLKFIDEATAFEALYKPAVKVLISYAEDATPIKTEQVIEGEFTLRYEGMSVDTIGVIYDVDNTDPENPVVTPLEGWHVNTRGPIPQELLAFSVVPSLPRRVWA
jgi:hypothetical protein